MESCRGRLAVVTGASSGIGLCFCRELARRGCNLIMVSNQDSQTQYAGNIAADFGVTAYPFVCDLTADDSIGLLLKFIDSRRLAPDYLINNAGIFSFREVTATDPARVDCFIDLHVRAVTRLSREFALRFVRRGSGRILNMSSMSCWMPMPGIALYSATKAYIRVFSRALCYELRDSGVSVTVACPGGIATDLFGLSDRLKRLAVSLGVLTRPETFARKAIDRMLKGRKQYINGLLNRLSIFFVAITPTSVRMMVKHRLLDRMS